jgi:tetratricopeptide (TPR) repeat protein
LATGLLLLGQVMAVTALFSVAAAPANAEDKTASREHWERGTKFYDLGKFDDAIREFEAAYEAKSDPAFLYNLAQSHRLAGHNAEALRFYRTYLRYVPKAANRADIEDRIKELEKSVADHPATEPPATAPPPALGGPAGAPAPSPWPGSPSVVPTPGPPSGPTASPATAPASAVPSNAWQPSTAREPAPASALPGPMSPAPPGNPPEAAAQMSPNLGPVPTVNSSGRRTAGIAIAAAGGGLFVVGAIFGLVARNQSKKVETAANNNERFDPSVESLGKASQALQWVGLTVGAVAVAAGLILYTTSPAGTEQPPPPPIALAPLVARDGGGALLRVSF